MGAFLMVTKFFTDRAGHTRKACILLGLAILLVVLVRVRLLDVPLERDEGEYAYMGQLLLQGIPPYGEAYNMKFPGTYLMYALIMAIFGQDIRGIHLGLMMANCATIILMYLLARKIIDDIPSAVAAGTYGILSLSSSVFGFAAHAAHFVVLPALGGALLLFKAIGREKRGLFFLSGVLLGLSVVMKQPGLFFVLFGAAYIIWQYFYSISPLQIEKGIGGSAGSTGQLVIRLGMFCAGTVLPLLIAVFWLYMAGVFDRFWFWTVVYASRYASQVALPDAFLRLKNSFYEVIEDFFPLWILSGLGLAVMLFDRRFRTVLNNKVFVLMFTFFSFLSVCPGFYFRAHYYITLLPAVSLLAGVFIHFLVSGRLSFPGWRHGATIGVVVFVIAAAIGFYRDRDSMFNDNPVMLSEIMYSGNPFRESIEVARFIRERTSPDDRIAVLGSEPQIFFYSKRRSATGYIYVYSLMERHEYVLRMQKDMISEVESSKPKFLIDVRDGPSWQEHDESEQYIFQWLEKYIAENYDLVGIADMLLPDDTIYKWYDDARNYRVQSPSSLFIYQRR